MLKNAKKTKIVCTLGPASDSEEVLTQLVENGLNVCTFNFSLTFLAVSILTFCSA